MATFYQTEPEEHYESSRFVYSIEKESVHAAKKFKAVLTSYSLFHFSFLFILALQTLLTTLLLFRPTSIFFAISLGAFFLSFFSYIILIYYFQGKKPEQFSEIKKSFVQSCKKHIPIDLDDEEYHLSLASSICQLASLISHAEIFALSLPPFHFVEEVSLKISYRLNWKDAMFMQEKIIHQAIHEHIELIKLKPTNLAAHTSLANAYIVLSKIYAPPQNLFFKKSRWIGRLFDNSYIKERSLFAIKRAIEELKIIDDLAPNDPWVHAQLASCYSQLDLKEEELREYEVLSHLRPQDKEILLRLGLLYFHLGKNAKGLTIYESLRHIDAKDAQYLISQYNSMYL
jgi:tetratricopeptide (TPR) repeat protein